MRLSFSFPTSVGVLTLITAWFGLSLTGCGALNSEAEFTVGICDILNCDTLFFLDAGDSHDDMDMDDDHDDMDMDDDHDDDMDMDDDHDDDMDMDDGDHMDGDDDDEAVE